MGKLAKFGNVTIRVYANDHLPPHFHAIAPDFDALILIDGLSLYRGSLPPRARRVVLEWAAAHQAEIAAEWNRINARFPIA